MKPVVLIGPMAAGKTSVGRKLARRLERRFVDTDREFTKMHGPIPDVFVTHGEARFRELEAEIVQHALADDLVVALGGGSVLNASTRALLADTTVVLVMVDAQTVKRRIASSNRPLLAEGGIEAWQRILSEREEVYRSLADCIVDTSHRPIQAIVDEIEQWLKEQE